MTPAARPATWKGMLAARLYQSSISLERAALEQALELAELASEDRLLDVATGTGALLRMLASRGVRAKRAIGVDRSRSMLTLAPPLPDGWAVVEGDARTMPFADHSFDVVTICYLLHLPRAPGPGACPAGGASSRPTSRIPGLSSRTS